jgi:hypothetical protein
VGIHFKIISTLNKEDICHLTSKYSNENEDGNASFGSEKSLDTTALRTLLKGLRESVIPGLVLGHRDPSQNFAIVFIFDGGK